MQPLHLDTWRRLVAERPLAILDTETTGDDAEQCGVCEIAVTGYGPAEVEAALAAVAAGDELAALPQPEPAWSFAQRVNPGLPIHPGATEVHGIRDEDVAGLAGIEAIAGNLQALAETHTIVTYNGRKFDLPILARLAGVRPRWSVDLMGLWRDALTRPVPGWFSEAERAAGGRPAPRLVGEQLLRCGGVGRPHTGAGKVFRDSLEGCHYALLGHAVGDAHQALGDVLTTGRALFALLALWGTDGGDADALARRADWALAAVQDTPDGPMMAVGKHKGLLVRDVHAVDPSYLGWALCSDFDDGDKARIIAAIGEEAADRLVAGQARKGGGRGGRKPRAAA